MSARYDVRDNPQKQRFEVELPRGDVAIADYRLEQDRIVFTHTMVPKAHEGHGVGSALIHHALASARRRGLKVVPACEFFAAHFEHHPEDRDLLDPEFLKTITNR